MLVDINLLPKKERRSNKSIYILFIFVGATILCLIAMLFIGHSIQKKNNALAKQVNTIKEQVETSQTMLTTYENSNAAGELEKAVIWAEDYPIKTVPIIRELTSYLPERGYILSFLYNEDGTIQLEAQFDTTREAAYYLKRMMDSAWITDVTLSKLSTTAITTSVDEGALSTEQDVQRYNGSFQIFLNKETIKEEEQGDSNS
jgi:type IV pilus assembly protein PilN